MSTCINEPSSSDSMKSQSDRDESTKNTEAELTSAQRARIERNRLRARELRGARLQHRPTADVHTGVADTGGGFLLEEPGAGAGVGAGAAPRVSAPHAPVVDPSARPRCLDCGLSFAQSHLFDTFEYAVCDECRDDENAHALITRTDAKTLYLLKECDLDSREPALRCVRRRNPHSARYGDMRLYLRAQVEERALVVWGSEEALGQERARREQARALTKHKQTARRLRALRMDVRSSLFDRTRDTHDHQYGDEQYDENADVYTRRCTTCPHVLTYEKM